MNKAMLIGRLTRDPDYSVSAQGNAVAHYTLAVDRRYKKEGDPDADFIRCACFGKNADFARNYLFKGTKILVEGHIQTGGYEKDGVRHNTFDVIVEQHEFVESKSKQSDHSQQADQKPVDDSFIDVNDWSELPFK